MSNTNLPVAVIGAGPIGLAAAAHLTRQGETPLILEAGASIGASILEWGHVRLFTPWRYATDPASTALLEPTGWEYPDPEQHPTGAELVESYLKPLAALPQMQANLRLNSRVIRIARSGFDKMKSEGREQAPFGGCIMKFRKPYRCAIHSYLLLPMNCEHRLPVCVGLRKPCLSK